MVLAPIPAAPASATDSHPEFGVMLLLGSFMASVLGLLAAHAVEQAPGVQVGINITPGSLWLSLLLWLGLFYFIVLLLGMFKKLTD